MRQRHEKTVRADDIQKKPGLPLQKIKTGIYLSFESYYF